VELKLLSEKRIPAHSLLCRIPVSYSSGAEASGLVGCYTVSTGKLL
jgi:hypothetical protein